MAAPPSWCSHVYAMRYEPEDCWCEEPGCGARWRLSWRVDAAGNRIPAAWTYVGA